MPSLVASVGFKPVAFVKIMRYRIELALLFFNVITYFYETKGFP